MKKLNIGRTLKQKFQQYSGKMLVSILAVALFSACQEELPNNIVNAGALTLSASKTTLELNQKNVKNTAFDLNWTTGTNNGSGASISYLIQIDKKGNNFSKAVSLDMGKGIYTKSFTVEQLNDSLLIHWAATAGTAVELEAR
ncbi:MAG TPA: SusE domain-containing protein, partial [Paludibacter sp.]